MASFETGMQILKSFLMKRKDLSAYFANEEDALHKAFPAKATVHSGPFGIPMLWSTARKFLDQKSQESRTQEGIAYIHIPFCESRCLFCMFYQNPYSKEAGHRYTQALIKELQLWSDRKAQNSAPIKALYFGGGTPSALETEDLVDILKAARTYLPLSEDCEITLESRLHNLEEDKFEAMVEAGVNRFSFGVQTFDAAVRKEMQRLDSPETVIRKLESFCKNEKAAIVIDLLFGFPGQKGKVWSEDLRIASELPLDGVDCYQLNVFEKSPLNKRIEAGLIAPAATLAEAADMFKESVEVFSNHSKWKRLTNTHWQKTPLERNIYNRLAKGATDCLPFGCGAGGKLFGYSWMQERKLEKWFEMVEKGQKPIFVMMKPQDHWHLLRTVSSSVESGPFNLREIGDAFGTELEKPVLPVLDQWMRAGLLEKKVDLYVPTIAGQFWYVTMAQLLTEALTSAISKDVSKKNDPIVQSVYSPNQAEAWLKGISPEIIRKK